MRPWEASTLPQQEGSVGGRIARILADAAPLAPEPRAAAIRADSIARYEDLLRSTVDWLWETDAALAITYVSSPVALKLGLPAQVLLGRPLASLGRFVAGNGPEHDAEAAIRARRPFRLAAFAMTGSGARQATYHLSGVPYFDDENGRFAGYRGTALLALPGQGTALDSDLRALTSTLEEALLRQQELAARLAQRPGAEGEVSLAKTAHELRTPLNAIIGYADLALSGVYGPLAERHADCLRSIREAGQHLDRLVVGMHEAAKSPEGRQLAPEDLDLAELVTKAKALVALAAETARIDMSQVGPGAAGRGRGDRVACTQILVNLLTNAIKFTPAGGRVGLETRAGSNGMVEISVWDSGVGIAREEQAKIFESRYRVQPPAGGHAAPGQGFGLAIARDLARAMGGDLTVASTPGKGSRFTLSLPGVG